MMTQTTNPIIYSYYNTATTSTAGATEEEETILTADEDAQALGKDEFLRLLMAQLQNQDPLNPADNTEFIAQLAQFSSLEQMTNMNQNLEDMLVSNNNISSAVSNAMIINYFGKSVTAETAAFNYGGEGDTQVTVEFADDIIEGTMIISDVEGNIVDVRELGGFEAGEYSFNWDGVNVLGTQSEAGIYAITIEAYNRSEELVKVTPLYTGTVQGVSYKDGETMLDIDGIMVPFANIRNITNNGES